MDAAVAKMSRLVEIALEEDDAFEEDDGNHREIQLPRVDAAILAKIIEFCTHYQQEEMSPIDKPIRSPNIEDLVQPFYADFINVDKAIVFELISAANFMDIPPLLELGCLAVACMITGKSTEEMRTILNITNDFTPDEEAAIREENRWIDDYEDPIP